jgi:hypothetical protein
MNKALPTTGRKMRRIKKSLDSVINNPLLSEQLAFDLVEIYEELNKAKLLIGKLKEGKKPSAKDLQTLETMLTVHWPYHITSLKKSFRKLR